MSEPAIIVEGLSKRFLIGQQRSKHDGLRHRFEEAVRAPLRWWRRDAASEERAREFWAVRDVSFSVGRGEVVGIVGRNGAGKSTLLKLLSRITQPTAGRITINGRVASLLEVGTGFHPELSGRENIYLNGAILGMSRAEITAKFDEIVAFSEVEKFLDTPVKRYSSGMYVRLAFAVAAHLQPEVLIVDEVLAVGDAQFQRKCLGKMSEVAKGGRTVLFVSHNMAAVRNLCNRGVLLEGGRLKLAGSVDAIIAAYLSDSKEAHTFTRTHASGDGRVIVERLEVTSRPLQTGDDFECVFHLHRPANSTGELPGELALDFLVDETRVLQVYSRNDGQTFGIPPGRSTFRVTVPRLPLAPGPYKLSAWVGSGHVTYDLVPGCYSLTVETGSLVEGFYVENRGIPVVARSRWQPPDDVAPPAIAVDARLS